MLDTVINPNTLDDEDAPVTKREFRHAMAILADTFVSKEEFRTTIASLKDTFVTKDEFEARVATLASKEDLKNFAEDMKHHFGLAVEQFKSEVRALYDGYRAVDDRQRLFETEARMRFDRIERRLDLC